MWLRFVMSCYANFETGQTLCYVQTDATMPNIAGQQCWELLCPFARSLKVLLQHQSTFVVLPVVGSLNMVIGNIP